MMTGTTKDGPPTFYCPSCEKRHISPKWSDYSVVRKGEIMVFGGEFKCPTPNCRRTYETPESLRSHIAAGHVDSDYNVDLDEYIAEIVEQIKEQDGD